MSATIAAIAKKIIVCLATDKRTWKVLGLILGIIIAILLLPVMLLLAVGSQFSGTDVQQQYPDEITVECDKWQSRRTVDNFGLLQSYLCYDAESREIAAENFDKSAQDLYNSAAVKGDISTLPDTIGTALIGGDSIGIFVGDGKIVYAKSIADGVVKETVSDGNWSAWFEISDVQYGEEKSFSTDIQFEEYDPAVKNNLDLVQWAIQAHENGWGYVYGTYGNVLTESLLQDRASVFGSQVTSYMDFIRSNWMGKRTSDCVGLRLV